MPGLGIKLQRTWTRQKHHAMHAASSCTHIYYSHSLPDSPGLGLALADFPVGILGGCALQRGLVLGQVGAVEKWLLHGLLVAENTSDRLVVQELGQLEQKGVVDGGLGLLIGLTGMSRCNEAMSTLR